MSSTNQNKAGDDIDLDIIWNITSICGWDCDFCCVDAVQVEPGGGTATVRDNGLETETEIEVDENESAYQAGSDHLKEQGKELHFEEKLKVLERLDGFTPDIDFSGGDPLLVRENYEVVKKAYEIFPNGEIAITATGAGLPNYDVEELGNCIHQLEFTYDSHDLDYSERPTGYNTANLRKAREFSKAGVTTKAQTPLSKENMKPENIERIYSNLTENGIDEMLLMRIFSVGRGMDANVDVLDQDTYRTAISKYRELEEELEGPKVKLQCALKHLYPESEGDENPCDLIRESFGIMPDGTVIASPWAYDNVGEPLSEEFVLGSVPNESFEEIYEKPKVQKYMKRLDDNWGHCKIFSYFNEGMDEEALFKEDPLYN